MGNITFTFTNEGTATTFTYPYTVSDNDLMRLVTYLRQYFGTSVRNPDESLSIVPASPNAALKQATRQVMQQWKQSTITYETDVATAGVADTIPPIDVTEP